MPWYPCPDCCESECPIGSDSFPTDQDPPSGWVEVAGTDWHTTSGTLRTSTSNALLKYGTAQPDGEASMYVAVTVYGAVGDEFLLLIAYTDSNNFHFVKFTIGSPNGCMALYRRVGGVDTLITQRQVDAAASTTHLVQAYFGQGLFACQFDGDNPNVSTGKLYHQEVGYTGTYCGLGTGTISGEVRFDSFVFQKHRKDEDGLRNCIGWLPLCELLDDGIGRADDTNVGCTYNEAAGSWSVASNTLETTSSDAQLLINVKHPFDRPNVTLDCTARTDTDGDIVRLIVGRTGPNDYYCAEYNLTNTPGINHTLRQCVGGVFTDLATENATYGPDFDYNLNICFGGGRLSSGSTLGVDVATPAPGSYDAGLATGTVAGTIRFDSIVYRQQGGADAFDYSLNGVLELTCGYCQLDCCCGNDAGEEWVLTIEDLTATNQRCNNCTLDGEYTLRYSHENLTSCFYIYEEEWCDDSFGCEEPIRLRITLKIGPIISTGCWYQLFIELIIDGNPFCAASVLSQSAEEWTDTLYDGCRDEDLFPLVETGAQSYPQPTFPTSQHLCDATTWLAMTPTFTLRPA